jgi:hypothetical protein
MKQILLLFLLLLNTTFFAQKKYEYFGALKLNGSNESVITYRLVFSEKNGILSGYSISDIGGENETKNVVEGNFNSKTNTLIFNENDILYTKSKTSYTINDFCFVNFSGKIKTLEKTLKIDGNFRGLYKNKKKCIDGTIMLVGSIKLYKSLNKINDKIQKSKKVEAAIKQKVNPIAMLDSMKINKLIKNQNLNIFVKSDSVVIEIWDAEVEDGDKIDLYQNDKLILKNFEILNKKKILTINLENGQNTFRIQALNEGEKGRNTATIQIIDNKEIFDLTTSLKKDENASITMIRKTN